MELGHRSGSIDMLMGLAGVAAGTDRSVKAVRLAAAVESHGEGLHDLNPISPAIYERCLAPLRARMNPIAWQRGWDEGSAMTIDAAVDYALSDD